MVRSSARAAACTPTHTCDGPIEWAQTRTHNGPIEWARTRAPPHTHATETQTAETHIDHRDTDVGDRDVPQEPGRVYPHPLPTLRARC